MLKNFKPIVIVAGDPKSVFLELYFKSLKKKKFKNPQPMSSPLEFFLFQG